MSKELEEAKIDYYTNDFEANSDDSIDGIIFIHLYNFKYF